MPRRKAKPKQRAKPKRKSKQKSAPRRPGVTGRPPAETPDWKDDFLNALTSGYHVVHAAQTAKIHISRAYRRRDSEPDFAKLWAEAVKVGLRELKAEASRRAYHGTLKPIYQQGHLVGHVREYSDSLLKWLIQVRDPRYRDKIGHEHTGKGGGPVQTDVTSGGKPLELTDDERLNRLLAILKSRGAASDGGQAVAIGKASLG